MSAGIIAPQTPIERQTWRGFRDGWTYRKQFVKCARCRACKAGHYSHGPYWYAERVRGIGTKTKYVGKTLRRVPEGKTR